MFGDWHQNGLVRLENNSVEAGIPLLTFTSQHLHALQGLVKMMQFLDFLNFHNYLGLPLFVLFIGSP